MIEKQRRLYRIGGKFDIPDLLIDPPKVTIKTELDDNCMDGEDVFVDCAPFITINDLKREAYEKPPKKKKYKKKRADEVTSDEHQKLFNEFKQVLRQDKSKK